MISYYSRLIQERMCITLNSEFVWGQGEKKVSLEVIVQIANTEEMATNGLDQSVFQ